MLKKLSYHPLSLKSLKKEVIHGLNQPVKELPCKVLYDERGSQIFDQICELPEYYLTRKENEILKTNIQEIVQCFPKNIDLIEYGSGSNQKTKVLLDHLSHDLISYIPLDISKENLMKSSHWLKKCYPNLNIQPVHADYQTNFQLPETKSKNKVVYFSGSTIGNFHPEEAISCLKNIKNICQKSGGLLIGVDLTKNIDILEKAYDDSQGVTKAFNMNALSRINREFDANFDLNLFRYHSLYNPDQSRVEMYLVSVKNQTIDIGDDRIYLEDGEKIWMESSYKYTPKSFADLVMKADFRVQKCWTDQNHWFSVQYLSQ